MRFSNGSWPQRVKSTLPKAAGAEPSGQMRDKKSSTLDHIWKKSKPRRAKDTILRPVSEIEMSKKCTALWRRARRLKHHMFGPLLDVQMSFCVASARDPASCQKSENRDAFVAGFKYNHHYPYTTLRYTTLQHYTTPHQLQLHSTLYSLHSTLKKICNHFIHSRRHNRQLQPPLNESVDSPCHP